MILFPAIDLLGGHVVRLERGDRRRVTVYSDDPAAVAASYAAVGASWVHVVDLSAAFEEDEAETSANADAIKAVCARRGVACVDNTAADDVAGCASFNLPSEEQRQQSGAHRVKRIYLSPRGVPLTQRLAQELAREDNLINKADDLFRYVMQLEQAMDQARQTMQIHFDDNDTKVRVAQTEVDKARAEHGADEMLQGIKDLGRKLDENQQQEILRRLDDLIVSLNGRGGKHSNPDEKVTDIAKDVDKIRKAIDEARKELEKIRTSVKTAAEQRRCIYCRNPLSKDARFCPACGKSQTGPVSSSGTAAKNKICSLCRTSNPPDATTCKNCGKEL